MDFNFDAMAESATSVFNRLKNAVMNYTEYEIKVRDATNNDPWGASSTLMNEISAATGHFHHFNEIMTTIYKRLEESSNHEWRKVYKALQLLEFLLKNGSENVIDSVKTHSRDISVLESFHYIDEKGKDQGINVRHRAKEILELVNNSVKLEQERIKARENKSKYTGVSSTGISSAFSMNNTSSNFGKSSFKASNNGDYEEFEKYKMDSGDKRVNEQVKAISPPPPVQEVNLLDFGDSETVKAASETQQDEWGDFTSATVKTQEEKRSSFGAFADFEDFSIPMNTQNPVKDSKKAADPFMKLVNLDALGSSSVKSPGPSLAALSQSKN